MISLTDILAYTLALGIAAAIPGPGMTALVARFVSHKQECLKIRTPDSEPDDGRPVL